MESRERPSSRHGHRRHRIVTASWAASWPLLALLAPSTPSAAAERLILVLPGNASIQLRNRQTLSGVTLKDLSRNSVKFVKGSKQSLPTSLVAAITFEGRVVARQNQATRVRGGILPTCRPLPDVQLSANGLRIQDDGSEASLNLQLMSPNWRNRIRPAGPDRALVITALRFDPAGQLVTMSYQDCPAGI
jgi:hypothetical protein